MSDSAKKRSAYEWFGMTPEERFRHRLAFTKKELAENLGISEATIHDWYKDYQDWVANPPEVIPITSDISPEEITQYKRLIFELANDPKSSSRMKELCARMLGILIERQEQRIKIEITADDLTRRHIEAERQLREGGYRMVEMPKESSLLPQDIREDTPSQ